MGGRERVSLREELEGQVDLEELEERLEMQRLPVAEEDYCSLNVCSGDCSEGTWCAGGYCSCDGSLCFCHGDCRSFCYDYCQDGGGGW